MKSHEIPEKPAIGGYIQLCVTLGMMAVAMIGTPMSHAKIFGLQGWRVAFVMIGSFPIFTSMLIKVGGTLLPCMSCYAMYNCVYYRL